MPIRPYILALCFGALCLGALSARAAGAPFASDATSCYGLCPAVSLASRFTSRQLMAVSTTSDAVVTLVNDLSLGVDFGLRLWRRKNDLSVFFFMQSIT